MISSLCRLKEIRGFDPVFPETYNRPLNSFISQNKHVSIVHTYNELKFQTINFLWNQQYENYNVTFQSHVHVFEEILNCAIYITICQLTRLVI